MVAYPITRAVLDCRALHMLRCLLVLIPIGFFAGCQRSTPPIAQNDGLSASKYIKRTNAETVVVFVPGLRSDSVSTWTNDRTHAYWPDLISRDPAFRDSDVYTYAYSSARTRSIDEVVEELNIRLTADEVFRAHKRVVFVCHSLGGLVVRAYLLRYRNQAAQVPLIFLLSPPSTGAALARLKLSLGEIPINGVDNGFLTSLNQEWRSASLPVITRCAYESRPFSGVVVVAPEDIGSVCDGQPSPVDEDHIQIAKPASSADVTYALFRTAFQNDGLKTAPPIERYVTETITSEPIYFELGCAESKSFQYNVVPARPLRPNQRIAAATPAVQDVANLKDFQIRSVSYSAVDATVTIGASGLDRDFTGNCRGGGHGRLVVTFVVTGPAN